MSRKLLRICITANDIAKIEECSPRTASQRMNDMRVYFEKVDRRFKITFKEYSQYSRIPLEDLEPFRLIGSSVAA